VTALETSISDLDDGTPGHPPTGPDAAAEDFTGLVRQVRERIHGWARRLTGDRDEAEDIAQDVLMRLHARLHAVEDRRRLVGWLYRVTHNIAHDRRALAQRRAELLQRFTVSPDDTGFEEAQPVSTEGLAQLVASFRDALSPQQRKIFTMVDLEGRTAADVSEELRIASSTVRVHLARARQTIRLRMLAEHPDLLEEYKE
jgi:RNA polymerase sigma-70 factor (ECF subfamily)